MTTQEMVTTALAHGAIQCPEELAKLIDMLRDENLENVLEIGTEAGGTMWVWCQIVKGIKISLDLPTGASGSWSFVNLKERTIRNAKIASWAKGEMNFITGDSHEQESVDRLKWLLDGRKLGLLFIDGDHSAHGVAQDYRMYKDFVKPGGFIVLHDIKGTEHHARAGCFVDRFWDRLEVPKTEIKSSLHWGGIGVIRV